MSETKRNPSEEERNGEKYGDRKVRVDTPLSEKLDNFWFHHKGKVIVGFLLLLVLILTVSQIVGRRDNNVMLAYAGPGYLSGEQQNAMQDLLSSVVSKKIGDGDFLVGVTQYQVYSEAQIESIRAETFEDGEQKFINSEFNSENYENLYAYIMTGDTAILMLDPWLYQELLRNGRLAPMSELFTVQPTAVDEKGYGVRLGETAIYDSYAVVSQLPEDTVLCFLKPQVIGKTSKTKAYAEMQETFRAIVGFEAAE